MSNISPLFPQGRIAEPDDNESGEPPDADRPSHEAGGEAIDTQLWRLDHLRFLLNCECSALFAQIMGFSRAKPAYHSADQWEDLKRRIGEIEQFLARLHDTALLPNMEGAP